MKANPSGPATVPGKTLRHIVAFKFKEATLPEQVGRVEAAFRELAHGVPVVAGFEWGVNNSLEGFDKGFTHGFIVTFRSEADRATYLGHAKHSAFVELAPPVDRGRVRDGFLVAGVNYAPPRRWLLNFSMGG